MTPFCTYDSTVVISNILEIKLCGGLEMGRFNQVFSYSLMICWRFVIQATHFPEGTYTGHKGFWLKLQSLVITYKYSAVKRNRLRGDF